MGYEHFLYIFSTYWIKVKITQKKLQVFQDFSSPAQPSQVPRLTCSWKFQEQVGWKT